jgi:hypothetical protein
MVLRLSQTVDPDDFWWAQMWHWGPWAPVEADTVHIIYYGHSTEFFEPIGPYMVVHTEAEAIAGARILYAAHNIVDMGCDFCAEGTLWKCYIRWGCLVRGRYPLLSNKDPWPWTFRPPTLWGGRFP